MEQDTYGDIVQHDFEDSYMNLTLKTTFMLKWINGLLQDPSNGLRRIVPKFVFKVDDDVFVNTRKLSSVLENTQWSPKDNRAEDYLILGKFLQTPK